MSHQPDHSFVPAYTYYIIDLDVWTFAVLLKKIEKMHRHRKQNATERKRQQLKEVSVGLQSSSVGVSIRDTNKMSIQVRCCLWKGMLCCQWSLSLTLQGFAATELSLYMPSDSPPL